MDLPERITIVRHSISIRPRYAETDRAGVIHHSVYPIWFEMGRTELLRANGLAYSDLEEAGIIFVVAELHIKYRRPAFYDQALQLDTTCTRVTASRAEHAYAVKDKSTGILLTEGSSTLACVDGKGKIQRMPEFMQLGAE
jgi:acyl-CoA thioester hydrolase